MDTARTLTECYWWGAELRWDNAKRGRFGGRFRRYHIDNADGRIVEQEVPGPMKGALITHWDHAPEPEYFEELGRISKNQIIWGGNYFDLPPTRCFLVWDKKNISESFSMSMCEYAWTSFNDNVKIIAIAPQGTKNEKRIHPTQKPVALYSWILRKYAKDGFKILDTHVGSGSSLIACIRAGLEYWGYEKDPVYFRMANERIDKEKAQMSVFDALRMEQMGMV